MDSREFPFGIMEVVELLRLNVRRPSGDSIYADCPFCGDRRGKLNVNLTKNVWRCNYCGEHGGMLSLYARINHVTGSEAYREICEALLAGDVSWSGMAEKAPETAHTGSFAEGARMNSRKNADVAQTERASPEEIHQTYSELFGMLTLTSVHREHLRSEKRGLTDEQIDRLGFKSTPPCFLCRSLTERLAGRGCRVEGVPGFYRQRDGCWTVKFGRRTSGILIPAVGIDGLIQGAQTLLDVPFKDEGDPPEKAGTKYIWFSSSGREGGTTSGSPAHFVGDPFAETVYVTEGLLKADIAHVLLGQSFLAVAGANNGKALDACFALLAQNGTRRIVEAYDMDKRRNPMVEKGSRKVHMLAERHGMECRSLTWDPAYKGIDDWLLAYRKEKRQRERERQLLAEASVDLMWKTCRFRLYQLLPDAAGGKAPFAFQGIRALYRAGYGQPPAACYRLVCDSEFSCSKAWKDEEILERIAEGFRGRRPEGKQRRPVASSDVMELEDETGRRYFYVDGRRFEPVCFSPFLARAM